MQPRILVMTLILGILSIFVICGNSWPVSRAEVDTPSMSKIPQWHCLRYFKHDVHLLRRCRYHRFPMLTRPKE